MMSRNELTRRVRHTTPIQFYPKRTLKNFKFSVYLVSVLMLWGGFISNANAQQLLRVNYQNQYRPQSDYMFVTYAEGNQWRCDTHEQLRQAKETNGGVYTCVIKTETSYCLPYTRDGEPYGPQYCYGTSFALSPDDPDECVLPQYFNPTSGLCDPNYTPPPPPPPPPEKNLGSMWLVIRNNTKLTIH